MEAGELALTIVHDVAEMKIQIQGRNIVVTEALKTHVLRRLAFALSRFGEKVVSVLVRFSNIKTRGGGIDKRCQIDVGLRRGVTGADRDPDIFVAVDRAVDRAGRSVDRALAEDRETENGPSGPLGRRN
jgi:ribosomal subunit interface protein